MDQTKFLSTKTQITNFHNHCEDNGCCLPSKQSYAVKFDAMGENNLHDPSWFSSEEREGNENGNAELTWLNHCDQNPWIVSAILENIPSRPRPRLKGTLFFFPTFIAKWYYEEQEGEGWGWVAGIRWTCWTLPKTVTFSGAESEPSSPHRKSPPFILKSPWLLGSLILDEIVHFYVP